ncbi:MAG: lanthionine synthetase C family protein [Pedobacter sp.]|jgi:lantibiotic modifying enzyme|uniref:lanthionine synthetase C family protein n=1 Tax=Pedobacter sp. TaxID=1411316 RepID=UPI00356170A5
MKREIAKRLKLIATEMEEASLQAMPMGLLGGKLGIALFFMEYSRFRGSDEYLEKGVGLIEQVFSETAFEIDNFSFYYGMSGLGWLMEYCNEQGFLEADTSEIFKQNEEMLYKRMVFELSRGHYDFLVGGLGIFLYFLAKPESEKVNAWLTHGVDLLEDLSIKEGNLISWPDCDFINLQQIQGQRNLGLSHGVPSILVVLCKAYHSGIDPKRTHRLISMTTDYLLSLSNGDFEDGAIFPSFHIPGTEPERNSRLGWCYGDLGVCLSLHAANMILKDRELDNVIKRILAHAAKRRDQIKDKVNDSALCHGSAGIGHIFNKFAIAYSDPTLKESADYWFGLSLEQSCGNRIELLEGLPGVGLAYISYLKPELASWEQVLLMA